MVKTELKDAKGLEAPHHFLWSGFRLQGKEVPGATKFSVGLSHYLPGGGTDFLSSPNETIYFCVEGEITVTDQEGNKIVLQKNDSLFIAPNEGRSVLNETKMPASMLVINSTF